MKDDSKLTILLRELRVEGHRRIAELAKKVLVLSENQDDACTILEKALENYLPARQRPKRVTTRLQVIVKQLRGLPSDDRQQLVNHCHNYIDPMLEQEIKRQAYNLSEEHNHPPGRAQDFWLQAEQQVYSSMSEDRL